jgi:pimeloyl-ACP methyl ester carboxylesterase
VLYEPPWPDAASAEIVARLEHLGARQQWDALVETFLTDLLQVPRDVVSALQQSPEWAMWTADAKASLGDLRALIRHVVVLDRYRMLTMPVMLLVGTESPRGLYLTDALAATLPNARVVELMGQAHEGMTTDPQQFADAVIAFLATEGESIHEIDRQSQLV